MIDSESSCPVRAPFRFLAGIIAVCALLALLILVWAISAAHWAFILEIPLALVFGAEFGAIAIRGDGLFLFNFQRMAGRKNRPQNH